MVCEKSPPNFHYHYQTKFVEIFFNESCQKIQRETLYNSENNALLVNDKLYFLLLIFRQLLHLNQNEINTDLSNNDNSFEYTYQQQGRIDRNQNNAMNSFIH